MALLLLFAIADFVWDRVLVGGLMVGVVALGVARLHEVGGSIRHVIQERTANGTSTVLIPRLCILSPVLPHLLPDLDVYDLLLVILASVLSCCGLRCRVAVVRMTLLGLALLRALGDMLGR